MKFLFKTLLLFSLLVFFSFKDFDRSKPSVIFVGNGKKQEIFKDKYLKRALKKFNFKIINAKKRPDIVERYKGKNSLPFVFVLNEKGQIITRESNFTASTLTGSLLRYLEAKKDSYLKKNLKEKAKKNTIEVFGDTYFHTNDLLLNNRKESIINFFNERKKKFMGVKLFPLLSLYLSVFSLDGSPFLKLEAQKDIDTILNSKIFDKDHICKYSIKDWNHPVKDFSIKENIKLLKILDKLKDVDDFYKDNFNKLSLFLYKELKNNIEDREKLNIYATLIRTNKDVLQGDYLGDIEKIIERMENKFILINNIAILNVYSALKDVKKISAGRFKEFFNSLIENYYLDHIFMFMDVEEKNILFYKYASVIQNLELASILDGTEYSSYIYPILTAVNNSSLGYLVNSQYLYLVSKYK